LFFDMFRSKDMFGVGGKSTVADGAEVSLLT
jgi:hypothetical protein